MCDLTKAPDVAAHMSEAASVDEWVKRANAVAVSNGGHLPDFWHDRVVSSGLMLKTIEAFSCWPRWAPP